VVALSDTDQSATAYRKLCFSQFQEIIQASTLQTWVVAVEMWVVSIIYNTAL
jgi:hypothetical protein